MMGMGRSTSSSSYSFSLMNTCIINLKLATVLEANSIFVLKLTQAKTNFVHFCYCTFIFQFGCGIFTDEDLGDVTIGRNRHVVDWTVTWSLGKMVLYMTSSLSSMATVCRPRGILTNQCSWVIVWPHL